VPNQNIDEGIVELERDFRAFGNFFKHQAKKARGRGTKAEYRVKAMQCAMLAQICQNLQTIT
jgi:hypothetical protein